MATVPAGAKLIFADQSVDTTEKKPGAINDKTHVHTIEEVTETVTGDQSGFTKLVVNVSAAQILDWADTPIYILPTPGANEYYEYHGHIEYTHVTTGYTFTGDLIGLLEENSYGGQLFHPNFITTSLNKVAFFNGNGAVDGTTSAANDYYGAFAHQIGGGIILTGLNGTEPTGGDGTLRVVIYYKLRTFGA